MEKTLDKSDSILKENEKIIANILHDIKSPLYSIKIALENKLDTELNRDIFETTLGIIGYIENFLVNYNFKTGLFNGRTELCNIKSIINKKIESYKYLFISRNIKINIIDETDKEINIKSIKAFLSSIIGNIISNIAFHAADNTDAVIKIEQKKNCTLLNFKNKYNNLENNFSLGLKFCEKLSENINANLKFNKGDNLVSVELRVQDLKNN